MAAGKRLTGGAILTVAFMVLAFAPAAGATTTTPDAGKKFAFPSATSTVVGSVGFINDCEIGYFWSAARGDSVSQTIHSYKKIKHVVLDVSVIENFLSNGAEVDWTLSVNGHDVGSFVVSQGFLGVAHLDVTFGKIKGPNFDIRIRVTNEVPSGDGSITLAYSDCGTHQIILKKK
jgi:hypothetical protein